MLLYYITDRRQFAGDAHEQRRRLLDRVAEAAAAGMDYVQLREKDLSARELERLAGEALDVIRSQQRTNDRSRPVTRLLINSRSDIAMAVGASGVHLRADDPSAADVRALWRGNVDPVIAVSCHSESAVRQAAAQGADFAVFAPVFEKEGHPGTGLSALRYACSGPPAATGVEAGPAVHFPVLALGGVTSERAGECLRAGAAGIAGIRLFQEGEMGLVVLRLRALGTTHRPTMGQS